MATQLSLRKEILQKQQELENTKTQLKKEFIGIDSVIDEMIGNVSSWYLFPELQNKPVIINLWGLTGVGKSSLVKRFSEIINFSKKTYRFDLGESSDREWAMKSKLEDIYEQENGYPIILIMDEFQHVRSIDEDGKEIDKTASRIVWELLDSGKFQITKFSHHAYEIYNLMYELKHFLKKDVVVKNGMVIRNQNYFIEEMGLEKHHSLTKKGSKKSKLKDVLFVPESYHASIHHLLREKYPSVFEIKSALLELDGEQTITFLFHALEMARGPKTVDCSKSLIFVLGNLDEAYTMCSNYNPDMDADEFHEQSLKINISDIKKALRNRFRNEQIARLGNIHIIYPAFNRDSFQKIIKLELQKISDSILKSHKISILFDETICDLIYKEGVYPTQGTRPVFTTIHQIINTKLGRILTEMIVNRLQASCVVIRSTEDVIIVDFLRESNVLYSFSEKQILGLEKLRKNRKDDLQAITAVHESGHAVITMILLKTIPEAVYSITAETESHGFVYTKFKWKYTSKNQIIKMLAVCLGGFAAEKIIFGDENVTTGAATDIRTATSLITDMLRYCGMGKVPGAFQVKTPMTNNYLHDEENILTEEAKTWLTEAAALAEKTLKEQELLLLKLSAFLADNRYLSKGKLSNMLKKYAVSFNPEEIIENGDHLFYRKCLKNKIMKLKKPVARVEKVNLNTFEFSLNRKDNTAL